MVDRQITDVSEIIENQKLSGFIIQLIVVSWIVTFFDGFDMNAIAFVAPELTSALHLNKLMLGNLFSIGLAGTMIGGFLFGYLGDRFGRRPSIIFATVSFGILTLGLASAPRIRAAALASPGTRHRHWRHASALLGLEYRICAAHLSLHGRDTDHARLFVRQQFCRAADHLVDPAVRLALGFRLRWMCRARRCEHC